MRSLAFASLLVIAGIVGACSAVDNFNKFTFTDGGASGDMLGLPGFGQPCTDSCAPGATASQPLMCFHMFGSRTIPGGICTRTCTMAAGQAACADYGLDVAACATVEGMDVCLPRCDPSLGRNCRTGFSCCANMNVVTVAGACAPTQTNLCH